MSAHPFLPAHSSHAHVAAVHENEYRGAMFPGECLKHSPGKQPRNDAYASAVLQALVASGVKRSSRRIAISQKEQAAHSKVR